MNTSLLSKYDVAAPRYTSYPTVPYWSQQTIDANRWLTCVSEAAGANKAISLYIHLPFCESLCTYCGCNKHITKNHKVEHPYLQAVLAEWQMYRAALPGRPLLAELHLGGGTPTFFQPENLRQLIESILKDVDVAPDRDFGFEAHPWSTTRDHLQTLYDLGFRRISIGVQDFDEDLMKLVNRQQTIASVVKCTEEARQIGYESVNYDLIYGLPRQTPAHIERCADYLEQLRPDRIAFYSYAHVPWLKKSQCAYSEADLPTGADKRLLYETGRRRMEAMGYREIGMDHFALPHDSLYKAMENGTLHRNFMGYTTSRSRLMVGLGASAIGDTWDAFAQNEKTIAGYQQAVGEGRLPVFRGHFLDAEDQLLRRHILQLMTRFETSWAEQASVLEQAVARLEPLATDGLVVLSPMRVKVTEAGRPFLRNICMAFDAHYWKKQPEGKLFSQSV
jgi:oxygen-independent coproporphyrinogen-3 oxidase